MDFVCSAVDTRIRAREGLVQGYPEYIRAFFWVGGAWVWIPGLCRFWKDLVPHTDPVLTVFRLAARMLRCWDSTVSAPLGSRAFAVARGSEVSPDALR